MTRVSDPLLFRFLSLLIKERFIFQDKIFNKTKSYILGNNQVTCQVRTKDPLELGYCVFGFRDICGNGLFNGSHLAITPVKTKSHSHVLNAYVSLIGNYRHAHCRII